MRPRFSLLVVLSCLSSAAILLAQTQTSNSTAGATPNSAQAVNALQNAITALAARSTVSDVTLTGTVEWIAGSEDKTGNVTYKALLSTSRLDMNFSGGARSEIRTAGTSGPSGVWVGLDGVSHRMAYHNLLVDPGWFPLFALWNINSSPNSFLTYVGQETRNGEAVVHLVASQRFQASPGVDTALMQHLTQVDVYLDSTTLLPISYVTNIHPDDNELLDIPSEIRYSSYKTIAGLQIPLHVQKFVNNNLSLDLLFQNAALNTGISAAQINTQ